MGRHYPHDLYEEIPILEAARRCGLVLNDRTLEWDEVEASCPFCGDRGPGKYHLSLNTRKNQYRCNLCEASGNSVSLYARMNGTSYRQAHEVLSKDGGIYRFPQQPLSQKPPEPEPKPLAMRHDVYYDMLSHLTLSPKHHNDLLSRGLSEERISQNMYRSLPSGTSARRLLAGMLSDFHDLEGIPGFYVDKDGFWNISGHSGLLVPYCTMDGYIQGLQVRLDDEKNPERKYRWLASRGRPHGVRCPAWIHVTGNPSATTAYLTEGGLKGDVASFLDDDALFLCFAGVTAVKHLEDMGSIPGKTAGHKSSFADSGRETTRRWQNESWRTLICSPTPAPISTTEPLSTTGTGAGTRNAGRTRRTMPDSPAAAATVTPARSAAPSGKRTWTIQSLTWTAGAGRNFLTETADLQTAGSSSPLHQAMKRVKRNAPRCLPITATFTAMTRNGWKSTPGRSHSLRRDKTKRRVIV